MVLGDVDRLEPVALAIRLAGLARRGGAARGAPAVTAAGGEHTSSKNNTTSAANVGPLRAESMGSPVPELDPAVSRQPQEALSCGLGVDLLGRYSNQELRTQASATLPSRRSVMTS